MSPNARKREENCEEQTAPLAVPQLTIPLAAIPGSSITFTPATMSFCFALKFMIQESTEDIGINNTQTTNNLNFCIHNMHIIPTSRWMGPTLDATPRPTAPKCNNPRRSS